MVDETNQDVTEGGEGTPTAEPVATSKQIEVDPARRALVTQWVADIKAARTHHDPAFKRMRECTKLAANGVVDKATAEALDGSYVVPIVNRMVNQAVATLYAKNPKAVAKRKQKLLYQLWDGDPNTLIAAMQAVTAQAQQAAQMGHNGGPPMVDDTGQPVPPPITPEAALLAEVQAVKQQIVMYDRMAKTMQLLFAYYLQEQDSGYKEQFKAMVRRTKVCGVSYVDLDFQRELVENPDIAAKIQDATSQITTIEAMIAKMQSEDADPSNERAAAEELRLLIETLQGELDVVVREGPVLGFPRAWEIIPDKECRHLKTFAGARWVAREFDMSPDRVCQVYKVEIGEQFMPYTADGKTPTDKKKGTCRLWRVQDKRNQQVFTVLDGYPDFIKEPAAPDVKIERFWTLFPLVFNEVESDDAEVSIFPPSDVWNARHMQREYNAERQGRREHRIAARPWYATSKGKLEDADKTSIGRKAPFEVIELNSMMPNEKVSDILQAGPTPGFDAGLYESESTFADILRVTGSQEANLGGTSGDTATEASIAENSRGVSNASDVDDLDTMLSQLARGMGQLFLTELSKETVMEIAGPGAVWPDLPPTREQIVKDLILEVEAGSSGRPNKAAELAAMERGMPYVTMLPGINPMPLGKKYLGLLDIDVEDAIVEGLPSIVAINQMAGRNNQAGAGPNDPNQQGDKGGDNASGPEQRNEPQSQPEYTAPGEGSLPI
jgi:hypothetical protein